MTYAQPTHLLDALPLPVAEPFGAIRHVDHAGNVHQILWACGQCTIRFCTRVHWHRQCQAGNVKKTELWMPNYPHFETKINSVMKQSELLAGTMRRHKARSATLVAICIAIYLIAIPLPGARSLGREGSRE
jgi:hypothetical protein